MRSSIIGAFDKKAVSLSRGFRQPAISPKDSKTLNLPPVLIGIFVMNWVILIFAGLMEVAFTFCLGKTKTAVGTEQYLWWGGFLAALAMSMFLMTKASKTLPVGTVYPVWTGIGAAGAVIVGILFFHEPVHFWRMFFISTLIISIVGLKLV